MSQGRFIISPSLPPSVVPVGDDLKQVEKEVEDVEVQAYSDIHGIVEGRRQGTRPPHVVADVQGKDERGEVVDDAAMLECRDEHLDDQDDHQTAQSSEERAAYRKYYKVNTFMG